MPPDPTISGSRAAPRSTVSPCAQTAASSSVSVAPTLGNPSVMSAPCSPAGAVRIEPCSLFAAVHSHLRKAGKMQVDGPCANAAPAGQNGLHPAKPCQQRCAEQDGCPHLCCSLWLQTADRRHALHRDVTALPAGRAARTPQKDKTGVHIRKLRHRQQAHRAAAQKGRRQQRQDTVLGCRDAHRTVQRHTACNRSDLRPCKNPRSAKDTSCYAERGQFVSICSAACVLFVGSFVAVPGPEHTALRRGTSGFTSLRGTPTARCPFRPAASSGWCRRRRKTAG